MTRVGKARSNAEQAAESLRALIFSGELAPGADHLETELAERLGMSRTPVREAIVALAGQGLLEVRPRKGVRVAPISPADMAEIYDILTELESLAAADAARARPDDAALAPVDQAVVRMEAALAAGDLEAWAAADDEFHLSLVRLGGNSRLIAIVSMMSDQVRRARLATLYLRPPPTASTADHRAVIDAISRGDADAARAIHRAHRTGAKTRMVALLEERALTAL